MICLQQPDHFRGTRGDAAFLLGLVDLIADVWTRRGTQALTSPVGSQEHPSVAREYRTECVECRLAHHSSGAPVVINDSGERSWSFRLVQHSVKCDVPARKRDDICCGQNQGRKQQ